MSISCPHVQLRSHTVNKTLWTFFETWSRDRSQSPPCRIFRVKQIHQSSASETTTQLYFCLFRDDRREVSKLTVVSSGSDVLTSSKLCPFCINIYVAEPPHVRDNNYFSGTFKCMGVFSDTCQSSLHASISFMNKMTSLYVTDSGT